MSLPEERAGRNEALFREVNESVEALSDRYRGGQETRSFVCECADADCVDRLTIPVSVYERVRENPRQFVVAAGHENLNIEHVTARGDGYLIVEKEDSAGRVAERTDPRR